MRIFGNQIRELDSNGFIFENCYTQRVLSCNFTFVVNYVSVKLRQHTGGQRKSCVALQHAARCLLVFFWATLCSMLFTITIARHAGFGTNDYIVLKLRIARNNNCYYKIEWCADINVHDEFFKLIKSPYKLITQSI